MVILKADLDLRKSVLFKVTNTAVKNSETNGISPFVVTLKLTNVATINLFEVEPLLIYSPKTNTKFFSDLPLQHCTNRRKYYIVKLETQQKGFQTLNVPGWA